MVCLLVVSFSMSGCIAAYTPVGNVANLNDVDLTSDFKTGESCAWFVLFNLLGPFGDMSVVKAAKSEGIRKAEVIDYRIENYFIAARTCAVVYGK
jgi:hypothetical protein